MHLQQNKDPSFQDIKQINHRMLHHKFFLAYIQKEYPQDIWMSPKQHSCWFLLCYLFI